MEDRAVLQSEHREVRSFLLLQACGVILDPEGMPLEIPEKCSLHLKKKNLLIYLVTSHNSWKGGDTFSSWKLMPYNADLESGKSLLPS